MNHNLTKCGLSLMVASATLFGASAPARAAEKKPNILVIFGDDIGMWNISAYNRGMMGYRTPNIDRDKPILAAITWGSAV